MFIHNIYSSPPDAAAISYWHSYCTYIGAIGGLLLLALIERKRRERKRAMER
jgi:hypothetical protein